MRTLQTASELWLTLSRAFLPPLGTEAQAAFREILPWDLHELCREAGVDARAAIDAFDIAAAQLAGRDELLVHYSGLFIGPPAAVRLNVALCLEGTVQGPVMDAIVALMAKHGIGGSDSFRDSPDHLSSLLEFLAVLEEDDDAAQDRDVVCRGFILPAAARMRAELVGTAAGSPYLHLLDVLCLALGSRAPEEAPPRDRLNTSGRPVYNRDPERGVWRTCARCSRPFAREKELAIIGRTLREQGLESDHLALCPDCRDPARGWTRGA